MSVDQPLVFIFHPKADLYQQYIREHYPDAKITIGDDDAAVSRFFPEAEVLLTSRCPPDAVRHGTKLRWVQSVNSGVENLAALGAPGRQTVITNARGIHGDLMSEYVLAAALMLQWDFPLVLRAQQQKSWQPRRIMPLAQMAMGIIGLGTVGREVARKASGLGMTVLGLARKPEPVEHVSRLFLQEQLPELLPLCDFVVLAVPSTAETQGLMGAAQFRAMKPTAFIINVARGSVVDEQALIRALEERVIGGACLDVFNTEPLPADSKLWDFPNVIVTPHIAGTMVGYEKRVADVFVDNLGRYMAGRPLLNVVDFERGY